HQTHWGLLQLVDYTLEPFGMDNKVVLITGASEGIGLSLTRRFQKMGSRLALLSLPSPGFEELANENTLVATGDITDEYFRRATVRQTIDRFGQIDILINNVGVGLYASPSTVDLDLTKRLFDINVFAPLALSQLVIPDMRLRKSGT